MTTPLRAAPVPAADNPRLLARLLETVARGVRTTRGLHEALGVDMGAVQATVEAGCWLGLLESGGEASLSELGLEYVYGGRQRSRIFAQAAWQQPFVARLMADRPAALPELEAFVEAVLAVEPELPPAEAKARGRAVRGLLAPALKRARPRPRQEGQLALPLAFQPPAALPPKIAPDAGREYNPDVHRYVLCSLLDHGELGLGHVRALLDRAGAGEAPIGGYVDLALHRGEAVRVGERLVLSREASTRRDLARSTASVILSDPGFRTWLGDAAAAAEGDRKAEVRRDRFLGRYRLWGRRLFGADVDPRHLDAALRRVLLDRSLKAFPAATGPGTAPACVQDPFLDAWEQTGLLVALPPSLARIQGGLAAVNRALRQVRQAGSGEVALPEMVLRPTAAHGGVLHPGEPLPRSIPDLRTLRLRLLLNAPYPALLTALLLLHRLAPERLQVRAPGGTCRVHPQGQDPLELLELLDNFAQARGWVVSRRQAGGLPPAMLLAALEATGIAWRMGPQVVLAERFFVALRSDAEEREVGRRLEPLAEALLAWIEQGDA